MIDTRYRKCSGAHAGETYVVVAPYSEIERPIQWMLHMEKDDSERCIVTEEDLHDPQLWEPLGAVASA